jgi:type IV secretion system protein VirB3
MATLRRLPIRRSLIRPLLLAGGERQLVMINCTFIACLIFGMGISLFTVVASALLGIFGQWCLVAAAKSDPAMSRVYLRHIHYQDFYPAKGSAHARAPRILPSIP